VSLVYDCSGKHVRCYKRCLDSERHVKKPSHKGWNQRRRTEKICSGMQWYANCVCIQMASLFSTITVTNILPQVVHLLGTYSERKRSSIINVIVWETVTLVFSVFSTCKWKFNTWPVLEMDRNALERRSGSWNEKVLQFRFAKICWNAPERRSSSSFFNITFSLQMKFLIEIT